MKRTGPAKIISAEGASIEMPSEGFAHPRERALESAQRIDPAVVASLYVKHGEELRLFVLGVLRDADLATDVLQATFAKAVEVGHTAREETLKGWLFRVAFHEALALRRKQAVRDKANRWLAVEDGDASQTPLEEVCRWETVASVRSALDQLPPEQRQVVQMRVYDQKKFITIAEELNLPLGTVLTRMQAALKKLRRHLKKD